MLRDSAIALMKQGLGFRDDLDTECVNAMLQAQRLVEEGHTLPDFLKQEDAALVFPAGSAEIALPTGFIREVDDEGPHYTDPTSLQRVEMEKFTNLRLLELTFPEDENEVAGRPRAYIIRKATIKVFPERDVEYNAVWSYYKAADLLDTNIENAWLASAPDILIGRAGMLMTEDIGTDEGMMRRHEKFKKLYSEAWAGLFSKDILKQEANAPLYMGGRL